ncbi:MAG: hypothetical protein OCC49_05645 [Fibrobacterales bacterium]
MSNKYILIFLLLAASGLLYYLNRDKRKRGKSRIPKKEGQNDTLIPVLQRLSIVNLAIRTTYGVPSEVITAVERLIDSLVESLPRLHDDHPSTEITWVVEKIANDHLMGLVEKYCALSGSEKESTVESFLSALSGLEKELAKINGLMNENDKAAFDTEAIFLKQKYFG